MPTTSVPSMFVTSMLLSLNAIIFSLPNKTSKSFFFFFFESQQKTRFSIVFNFSPEHKKETRKKNKNKRISFPLELNEEMSCDERDLIWAAPIWIYLSSLAFSFFFAFVDIKDKHDEHTESRQRYSCEATIFLFLEKKNCHEKSAVRQYGIIELLQVLLEIYQFSKFF